MKAILRIGSWGAATGAVLGCLLVIFESLFMIGDGLVHAWDRLDALDFLSGYCTLFAVYGGWGALVGAALSMLLGTVGRAPRRQWVTASLIWGGLLLAARDAIVRWTGDGPAVLPTGLIGSALIAALVLGGLLWWSRRAIIRLALWLPGPPLLVILAFAPLVQLVGASRWEESTCGVVADAHSVPPAAGPNILLVSLDTVRADALGSYGNTRAQTPRLDALAAEGTRFTRATIPMPITRPSHVTMLTGLDPSSHGVVDNIVSVLPGRIETLAESLHGQGYRTGAFVSSEVLVALSGLDQGFDVYDDCFAAVHGRLRRMPVSPKRMTALRPTLKLLGGNETSSVRPGTDTIDRALNWMSADAPHPFFAFVHLYDAHAPYLPSDPGPFAAPGDPDPESAPMDPELARFWHRMYEAEVAEVDGLVGRLLDHLDALGVADETVVVVTSDHGESFDDGYYYNHGERVFESVLRVPLIVRHPASATLGHVDPRPVAGSDLVPTLLDWAGVAGAATDGRSLVDEWEEGAADRTIYATSSFRESMDWRPEYATFRRADTKWTLDVVAGGVTWESLGGDQGEPDPEEEQDANDALGLFLSRALEGATEGERMGVDEATRERLRALGYVE